MGFFYRENTMENMDFYSDFDLRFCLFCFLGTTVMFFGVWGLTVLWMKDKSQIAFWDAVSLRVLLPKLPGF